MSADGHEHAAASLLSGDVGQLSVAALPGAEQGLRYPRSVPALPCSTADEGQALPQDRELTGAVWGATNQS